MKRIVLLIVPALIFGGMLMFIASCNKEGVGNSALSIYAFGQSATKSATLDSESENMLLWCTGNDIKWYNATTGELKLKNIPNAPFMTFFRLTIFLDEMELFSLETVNPLSSHGSRFPCINWEPDGEWRYKGCKCGNKQDHVPGQNCEPAWQYAGKGGRYFISGIWPGSFDEEFEAFEQGWNKFIAQLKKEGKYRK